MSNTTENLITEFHNLSRDNPRAQIEYNYVDNEEFIRVAGYTLPKARRVFAALAADAVKLIDGKPSKRPGEAWLRRVLEAMPELCEKETSALRHKGKTYFDSAIVDGRVVAFQRITVPDAFQACALALARLATERDASKAANENPPGAQKPKRATKPKRGAWQYEAATLVQKNPHYKDYQIAEMVCISTTSLSRNHLYQAAAKVAREPRKAPPRGRVHKDPVTGQRSIEAVDTAKTKSKADRGEPIPGSSLYREYCAECGDRMGVPRSQVNKKPLCNGCAE